MVVPSIVDVPPDIVLSVSEHLDIPTLLSLRSTSHSLDALLTPLALRCVYIGLDTDEAKVNRILTQSSQPISAIYDHARHLTLKTDGWYVSQYIDETRIVNVYEMIGRFKSLTSLRIKWMRGFDDTPETIKFTQEIQERFVDAVLKATGGRLRSLTMKSSPNACSKHWPYGLPSGLESFRGLRAFSSTLDKNGWYCGGRDRWGERSSWYDPSEGHECNLQGLEAFLQSLIHNTPQLETLVIRQGCLIKFYDADTLFADGSDDRTEKPLSALRTLTLKGVKFPCTISAKFSPFTHLQHLEVLSVYAILPLDNLWSSLQVAGTTLRTLKTHQVSHPLVIYLASYSGLQELTIQDIQDIPECASPKISTAFFQDALPRHSSSLTSLRLSLYGGIQYLEGWAYTPSVWVPVLGTLKSLKSVHLYAGDKERFQPKMQSPVQSDNDDDDEQAAKARWQRETNAADFALAQSYQEVLEGVEQMKSLERLEIIWPGQRYGCGTGRIRWLQRSVEVVSKAAEKLRSENGNPNILGLFTGIYHCTRDELGDSWRYVCTKDG